MAMSPDGRHHPQEEPQSNPAGRDNSALPRFDNPPQFGKQLVYIFVDFLGGHFTRYTFTNQLDGRIKLA